MNYKKLFPIILVALVLVLFPVVLAILVEQIDNESEIPASNPVPHPGWKFLPRTSGYHDYYEAMDYVTNITAAFPEITYFNASIGQSIEGRDIFALKISDNPSQDEDEPEALFFAQMHAREAITLENILALISHICKNYGTDVEITDLVDNREIWFIPILNPDGALYCAYNDSRWRKNRRDNEDGTYGVDLNRNFGYKWGRAGSSPNTAYITYRGSAPFSEPEAQALRDFVLNHNFSVSMSMHSYSGLWLWPWGYTFTTSPDDMLFRAIGEKMSQLQPYYKYTPESSSDLYITSGGASDWLYGSQSIIAFTVEIYSGRNDPITFNRFNPPSHKIQYEVENTIPAFLYFIKIADNPWNVLRSNE